MLRFMPHAMAFTIAGALLTGPVLVDTPSWAGGGKKDDGRDWQEGKGKGKGQDRDDDRSDSRGHGHFEQRQRVVVHEYYENEFHRGHCPPGLAKKHNGCMPPGQAKKWIVGRPLPREVIYYDVPRALVVQIGAPPLGHRYVRVASDILLIADGTGMVVDAINDLGR